MTDFASTANPTISTITPCEFAVIDARFPELSRFCTGNKIAMPHSDRCVECHEFTTDWANWYQTAGEGRFNSAFFGCGARD